MNTIVMSPVPSNVAAHATATSAPGHPVWFQQHTVDNNTGQTKFLHTKTCIKASTKTKGQAVN